MNNSKILLWVFLIIFHIFLLEMSGAEQNMDKTQNGHITHKKRSVKKVVRSQKLIVKTALKKFTLTYNKKKVAIKGYMLDLSLSRKKCNAHILDRFNKEIKNIIKTSLKKEGSVKKVKKGIETLEVQIGDQHYFLDGRLQAGLRFMSLPREITRMKWEEKLNCEKTNTRSNVNKKVSKQSIIKPKGVLK